MHGDPPVELENLIHEHTHRHASTAHRHAHAHGPGADPLAAHSRLELAHTHVGDEEKAAR